MPETFTLCALGYDDQCSGLQTKSEEEVSQYPQFMPLYEKALAMLGRRQRSKQCLMLVHATFFQIEITLECPVIYCPQILQRFE